MDIIEVKTTKRTQLVDISEDIQKLITKKKILNGVCFIFVPHTTCGILINENYDPAVRADIENTLNKIAPPNISYQHTEGNADSHIKSSLVGHNLFLFIENSKLVFGTWQGVFLAEFDGPRSRKLYIECFQKLD